MDFKRIWGMMVVIGRNNQERGNRKYEMSRAYLLCQVE